MLTTVCWIIFVLLLALVFVLPMAVKVHNQADIRRKAKEPLKATPGPDECAEEPVESTPLAWTRLRTQAYLRMASPEFVPAKPRTPKKPEAKSETGDKPQPEPAPKPTPAKYYQVEYAIGQGLITRDEYNTVRTQYFTQSQMSLGLIFPIILLLLACYLTPRIGVAAWCWPASGILILILLVIGMDRWHKFQSELQSLIDSRYQKNVAAAEKANADKKPAQIDKAVTDALRTVLRDELSKLKMELKPFAITIEPAPPPGGQSGGTQTPPADDTAS